jgi:iron complex transport system substrate-binding protein
MKICSFLPSGTEILFALGLGDSVYGVTFECDYPAEARAKPVVVYSKLPPGLPEKEIDRQVNEFSARGSSLYRLDAEKLREIQPDVIVTQDLCHVCAASPDDLGAVLASFERPPKVLALTPHTVEEVWGDIQTVGDACGRGDEGRRIVAELRRRIAELDRDVTDAPRVLCLEWLDPPFVGGHWVPEMVAMAGGIDVLGKAGLPGVEVDWKSIVAADPDIILAVPCGYHRHEVEEELKVVPFPAEWHSLRAVREGRVFAMDASSHFSRPGPRIAEGMVEMAELFARLKPELKRSSRKSVRGVPQRLKPAFKVSPLSQR